MEPLTSRETMAHRRRDGVRMEREAAAFVKPNDRLTSFQRLEIYNRQYWLRVLGSLREDYPGLRAVLGQPRFDALMRAYLAACPSTSFTLRNLGSRLAPWLLEQDLGPRRDLALDMARLEWAHIEAFDEAAEPLPSQEDLADLRESTRLGLQPHLRLLRLDHPVDDLLILVRRAGDGSDGDGSPEAARGGRRQALRRILAQGPRELFLAVHRHDLPVYYKRLAPEAFRILAALQTGAGLGGALEAGFQDSALPEPERPAFLQQAFQQWAAFGWFARPGVPQDSPTPSGGSHVHRA
jgi:hypothetical protein